MKNIVGMELFGKIYRLFIKKWTTAKLNIHSGFLDAKIKRFLKRCSRKPFETVNVTREENIATLEMRLDTVVHFL